jgi:hypothetical protein
MRLRIEKSKPFQQQFAERKLINRSANLAKNRRHHLGQIYIVSLMDLARCCVFALLSERSLSSKTELFSRRFLLMNHLFTESASEAIPQA